MELIKSGSEFEDWVIVKIDIKNAYNESCRAENVRVVEAKPSL